MLKYYECSIANEGGERLKEQKYRHELKHHINYFDYLELISKLKHIAKPDINADADGSYKIRSLYFDNLYDKALREKIDGISNREKFRIRYYNEETAYIKLEKKSKRNGLCQKLATSISKEQCQMLISGKIQFLKESNDMLFLELYTKMHTEQLRPKNIVDYTRNAFVFTAGNVRVTIDSDIRASDNVGQFLNPELFCHSVTKSIILEVKYDNFLPQVITNITQINSRQATAFSKYATCRTI